MDQSHKPRRPKSREVSSRFLSPTTPETTATLPLSPARRKHGSPITDTRRPKAQLDDPGSIQGLWPSSTTPKFDSLGEHLGHDRLKDRTDQKNSIFQTQRSSREDSAAKENHRPVLGGSARYTGKLNFSGKLSPSIVSGRFSVDGNGRSNRFSNGFSDDSGSECSSGKNMSPARSARKSGMEVSSKYMNDVVNTRNRRRWTSENLPVSADSSPRLNNKFNLKNVIKRANSLTGSKFGTTQWALSPGRAASTPVSFESMGKTTTSFSNLKPPSSPGKTKGVEKLINLGLDLFKSKKSSSSSSSSSVSSRTLVRSNSGYGVTDTGHQLRLLHNRLMQWRYANARAQVVSDKVEIQAQINAINAWDSLLKLRQSVVHKRLKLEKEKLEMKLNYILHSQFKALEAWGNMERQHMNAVCMMKECLLSVVCKVPLIEGAEVNIQSAAINLQNASDLTASIKLMLATFAPSAEETVSLLSKLAEVVAQEKLLSDECLELCRIVSTLEMQERSLRCSSLQLEVWKVQQKQLPRQKCIMP